MLLLDGKIVAEEKKKEISLKVAEFRQRYNRKPRLDVVLVGTDSASQIYVRNKEKSVRSVGMDSFVHHLEAQSSELEVLKRIAELNSNPEVDGILIQLPLPEHFNARSLLGEINPFKDVDGLTPLNIGKMWSQESSAVLPCTPAGIIELLDYYNIPIKGTNSVVIGRSLIVGRPMAYLLDSRQSTVTVCHSQTKDLKGITSRADLVIVAAGKPQFWGREFFKKGSVIVDVGIHRVSEDGKKLLVGDVRAKEVMGWVYGLTPVPGGVGPMTIAMLLHNTLSLACYRMKKEGL